MAEERPIEPASDDEDVQNFLDSRWRGSMAAARELMDLLRDVMPEFSSHMPEPAANRFRDALISSEHAYGDLHAAGKHIIGSEDYVHYLAAQTARKVEGGRGRYGG